jgi:hypothetical protein
MNIFTLISSSVALVFILFQLVVPYKPTKKEIDNTYLIQQNTTKYQRYEYWAIFWIFLSVALICFCVYIFGTQLRDLLFPSNYEYLVKAPDTIFVFAGMVLGFGLIRIPMEFVYKLMLKEEYYLYMQFTNMKHGFDGEKIWYPLERIFSIAGIVILAAGLNWFVRVDANNNIEFNELLSIKNRTYSLSEVYEINLQKYSKKVNEREIEKQYYEIKLKDRFIWNSKIYDFFAGQNDDNTFNKTLEKISKITQIEIEQKYE